MSKKVKITVSILAVLLACGIIAAAGLVISDRFAKQKDAVSSLEKEKEQLELNSSRLEMSLSEMENAKKKLEGEAAELEYKLSDAGKIFADEIEALKAEIAAKTAEIEALEADIAKYRTVFDIDVRAQAHLIDEIVSYIETAFPCVRVCTPDPEFPEDEKKITEEWRLITDLMAEEWEKLLEAEREEYISENPELFEVPDGEEPPEIDPEMLAERIVLFTEEELTSSGLTKEELTETKLREMVFARTDLKYPSVSVYYEDLATGYHFDYNADLAYNSASVIKAPYIMSVLRDVSAEEKAYLAALSEAGELPEMIDTDGDGEPDRVKYEYSDPTLDLYETVVYTKEEMYQDGSGKIKDMEDGTEFTYLDFIRYTLEYSDNVAYQALRTRFGFSRMSALASSLKVKIPSNTMTARGAGTLFAEIYKFINEDETYGSIMAESMAKGNHTVIIPYGVSPTKTLHKYGWDEDSYHDVAIVLHDDKPYVLAIFSDLDNGGNEVNLYLREIVKMINKLHKGFYKG